jgi:hypothetical protein
MSVLAQVISDDVPPPLSQLCPDLEPGVEAICLKAMAKKPEDRCATMAELAGALLEHCRARSETVGSSPRESDTPSSGRADEPARETQRPGIHASQLGGLRSVAQAPFAAALKRHPQKPPRRSPEKRKQKPEPTWLSRVTRVVCLAVAGFLLIYLTRRYYAGEVPRGEVAVTANGAKLRIVAWQDGKQVLVIDTAATQRFSLPPGNYQVGLLDEPFGFRLDPQQITVVPGETEQVFVLRVERPLEGRPELPEPLKLTPKPKDSAANSAAAPAALKKMGAIVSGPASSVPFRWHQDDLAAGRIPAPDFSRAPKLLDDNFSNPLSGFPNNGPGKTPRYEEGVYKHVHGDGSTGWTWNAPGRYHEFACEVVGRFVAGRNSAWGVKIGRPGHPLERVDWLWYGVMLNADGRVSATNGLEVAHHTDPTELFRVAPFPAAKPIDQWNRLMLIAKNGRLEVYLNGFAVADPVQLRPFDPLWTAETWSESGAAGSAEFKRFTVWDASRILPVEERARGKK